MATTSASQHRRRRQRSAEARAKKSRTGGCSWEAVLAAKDLALNMAVAAKDSKDEVLAAKDLALNMAVAAKDSKDEVLAAKNEALAAKDETLAAKDALLANMIREVARFHLVLSNRTIVEEGLRAFQAQGSMTEALNKFRDEFILKDKWFTKGALRALQALLGTEEVNNLRAQAVLKEFLDLYHELSKLHHFHLCSTSTVKGLACGGQKPLGLAVGVMVLVLERKGFINEPVTFVDEDYKEQFVLKGGKVQPIEHK